MGNLPGVRVTPARPFSKTGVDYAGPFQIRTTKGRGHKSYKGYLAIFVCMVTKAVHIEVASDLTTNAFLAAYKRFTARRGLCTDVYSDNGTNFIGANHELKKERIRALNEANEQIKEELATNGTTWHVIPPAASHFGGLWEAAVKSTKNHLKRVIGEQTLTFEELSTVVAQIEACLNSRPLSPITDDPSDLNILTPGHFLIGDAIIAPPQQSLETERIGTLTRWKLVEKINQDFWNRWSQDYLLQLQQRAKWKSPEQNLEIGQIVLIRDERLPPTKWLMARVTEVHPGNDNKVRVATVRGPGGALFKRPISKLSPLPITTEIDPLILEKPKVQLNLSNTGSSTKTTSKGLKDLKSIPTTSINLITFNPTTKTSLKRDTSSSQPEERKAKWSSKEPSSAPTTSFNPSARKSQKREYSINQPDGKKATTENSTNQPDEKRAKISTRDWMRGTVDPRVTELAKGLQRTRHSQPTKTKITPWMKAVLYTTTILCFLPAARAILNVTQFQYHPGIFFDEIGRANILRSEWNLVMYYDLTNYWLELSELQNATYQLDVRCHHNSPFMGSKDACLTISKQVSQLLSEVVDRNQILEASKFPTRRRRSPFDFIGNVANELFGVLDQRAAEKYDNQIEAVINNQAHIADIMKQQTSFAETTTNIIKRNRDMITNNYNIIQDELDAILFREEFMDATLRIIVAIISLKDVQEAIIDVIADVHHGRFNSLLFTPNQLEKQIQEIQRVLPIHLDLPTRQVANLYKLFKIKASILNDKVIFEIKIPLIDREEFQLLHIIPIPTFHHQQYVYIKPSTNYMLVSLQRQAYYFTIESDFQTCQIIQEQRFMCDLHQPLQNEKSKNGRCEIGLLHHEPDIPKDCIIHSTLPSMVWIQLHTTNSWIFVADKDYIFDSICNNTISPITISGSGILQLLMHCTLKGETVTLYSRSTYTTYQNKSYLPTYNLPTQVYQKGLPIVNDESDIKNLEKTVTELKKQQGRYHEINRHDVHHYSMTYVLFIFMAILSIIIIILYKLKRCPTSTPLKESQV